MMYNKILLGFLFFVSLTGNVSAAREPHAIADVSGTAPGIPQPKDVQVQWYRTVDDSGTKPVIVDVLSTHSASVSAVQQKHPSGQQEAEVAGLGAEDEGRGRGGFGGAAADEGFEAAPGRRERGAGGDGAGGFDGGGGS
jgi:hypothetical protein